MWLPAQVPQLTPPQSILAVLDCVLHCVLLLAVQVCLNDLIDELVAAEQQAPAGTTNLAAIVVPVVLAGMCAVEGTGDDVAGHSTLLLQHKTPVLLKSPICNVTAVYCLAEQQCPVT